MVGRVVNGSLLNGFNSGSTLMKFPCWLRTLPEGGWGGDDHNSVGYMGCDGIEYVEHQIWWVLLS